jgi:uncharacterized protein (TIGR00725 family)
LKRQPIIGVIGGNNIDDNTRETAVELGKVIAKSKAVLICGGLDGVMEAACEGAKSEEGTTIGVLPGTEHRSANEFVDIPIVTSLFEERRKIIARTADVAIVLEDSADTQSEIENALKVGTPVVSLSRSPVKEIENLDENLFICAESPEEAVATAMNIFNVLGDIKTKTE